MRKIPFRRLPLVVKLAVAATFFNGWVLFEEVVVDRQGLWRYMPLYRVGVFCAWDLAALLFIAAALWLFARRRSAGRRWCPLSRCALCR